MNRWLLVGVLLFFNLSVFGQGWMPGYEFRRKITFDKTKVASIPISHPSGTVYEDMLNFTALLELEDDAFKYRGSACTGILDDAGGRNVAFALFTSSAIKLSFQIESYDPVKGKYRIWIKLPVLASAQSITPATVVYFYYGGSELHDNHSSLGLATWPASYERVWHMNMDIAPATSKSINYGTGKVALGSAGMNEGNFSEGRQGASVKFNGSTEFMSSAPDTSTNLSISAWIKLNQIGVEQMIVANDSTTGGYRLKINAEGNLSFETRDRSSTTPPYVIRAPLSPNTWYHIGAGFSLGMKELFINGVYKGGSGAANLKLGAGGSVNIGRSKQNSNYFNGFIDELWIERTKRPLQWLKNVFTNQNDPISFCSIGAEEFSASWATFTGAVNTNWTTSSNWINNFKPVAGGKVRVLAGKVTKITGVDMVFGQLVLDAGAVLSSAVNLQINCDAKLGSGASLIIDEGKKLVLGGNGLRLYGAGAVNTEELELNTSAVSSEVFLGVDVKVSKYLKLSRGVLNSNGNLWLMASASSKAMLLPVDDLLTTEIKGVVNVQDFVEGSFPSPSSGRGWRLLSSPVVHSGGEGNYQYSFQDVKSAVFVTGKDGVVNDFDASPNNGATIYTHDQNLPGTLAKKFVPIPDINTKTRMGRGFYLYSRGSRLVTNAYLEQIQVQPFSNPEPYVINYKGQLYQGNLTVDVFNRNTGDEGDGFNLLGNPYAAPIRWGDLMKVNIGPFVWLWDPLNNAYRVTDDPDEIIPAGTGFFVKVLSGYGSGFVRFTEACKVK